MGDVSDGRLVLRSALFRRAPEIPTMEINIARARVDRGWEPSAALNKYNIYMCVCFCMCECVCVEDAGRPAFESLFKMISC